MQKTTINRSIKYCGGYKYQLRDDAIFQITIKPTRHCVAPLVTLTTDGILKIKRYFAWDGASGPTIDTKSTIRASLIHDALYYLMRFGVLDQRYRIRADYELRRWMERDGAPTWRAKYYEWAVNKFASACASPKNKRKVLTAP